MSLSSIVSLTIPKQLNHNMCECAQKCGCYYMDLLTVPKRQQVTVFLCGICDEGRKLHSFCITICVNKH